MRDPRPVDSEDVIVFRPSGEALEASDHQTQTGYETADERYETLSATSSRSCSPARGSNRGTESAFGQMTQMMSGMTNMFKDVAKELRELKQQVTGSVEAATGDNNNRNRRLSPNAESFRPRLVETGNNRLVKSQSSQQTYESNRPSSSPAEAPVQVHAQPVDGPTRETGRHDTSRNRPVCDDMVNDGSHYHGYQHQDKRLPSNQYQYDPLEVHRYDRNQNQGSFPGRHNMSYNRGDYFNQHVTVYGYRRQRDASHVKIPPFTGKDSWTVWITRFETLAERMGWDESDKLNQILPRIEGHAGEFVFSQLHLAVLHSYAELKLELHNRYRVIETPRLYASRFSRRMQKVGESAEDFAAELKVLYDKAHGFRDRKTRDEDLVRRFLDGLRDDDIRFEVEYNKEPETIDDAVFDVVNYIHTRNLKDRRPRENVRWAKESRSGSLEDKSGREMGDGRSRVAQAA